MVSPHFGFVVRAALDLFRALRAEPRVSRLPVAARIVARLHARDFAGDAFGFENAASPGWQMQFAYCGNNLIRLAAVAARRTAIAWDMTEAHAPDLSPSNIEAIVEQAVFG